MARQSHGEIRSTRSFPRGSKETAKRARIVGLLNQSAKANLAAPAQQSSTGIAFMFPQLQKDKFRLPTSPQTVEQLKALAAAMAEPANDPASENSDVPAVYTYLGQFIDHDVSKIETLPGFGSSSLRAAALLGPMTDPVNQHENQRLAPLDLDSLYTKAPEDQGNTGKLRLGAVSHEGHPVPGKDVENDLPRNDPSPDVNFDRAAQIGDPRNDENLIVAQLHVAFLRAHNALVEKLGDRLKARAALTELYLDIVFTDFLPRIADIGVLNDVLGNGRKIWTPKSLGDVPLEHTGAAYRFGHSMVRASYDFNSNFGAGGKQLPQAPFNLLFTFTALSGQMLNFPTLPENWVIEWERIAVTEKARRIDTFITPAMNQLTDTVGTQFADGMNILAERNLLRGYILGLPTGQAVAGAIAGAPVLSGQAMLDALPTQTLKTAAEPFKDGSPLWFYILAEAGASGGKLGAVGSRIVVETLHALAEATGAPVPKGKVSTPSGRLLDLLRLSGNLK